MQRKALAEGARFLGAALWLGLAASAVVAGLRAHAFARPGFVFLPLWEHALPTTLLLAVLACASWTLAFGLLARRVQGELARTRFALVLPWGAASAALLYYVHRHFPSGRSTPARLAADAALALFLLALGWSVSLAIHHGRRRAGNRTAVVGALAGLVGTATLPLLARIEHDSGPHVFVLLVDVLRADHLGCYGYELPTSPNIDRFAQDAVLFEQAMSQSTFTKTSVASIFTGLYPHHHGVYVGNLQDEENRITSDVLDPGLTTLAEEMRWRGFLTLGLVQNGQLRSYMGFDQGFDLYDDDPGDLPAAAETFRRLCAGSAARRRIFAYLHFLDLHGPYLPRPPYATRFGRYSDRYDDMDLEQWRAHFLAVQSGAESLPEKDARQLQALYDGQLTFVDEWIGNVLADLRDAGLYDESLIVFTADHGEGFLEHGFISHSTTPFEELVHVPLIVKLPHARNAGARVAAPVGSIDLLPTLLALVGGEGFDPRDGRSLVDLLQGPSADATSPRMLASEYQGSVAVREGRWKWIDEPGGRGQALYDLETDPGEKVDRQAEFDEIAQRLALRAQDVHALRPERGRSERVEVDAETQAELRALGYF